MWIHIQIRRSVDLMDLDLTFLDPQIRIESGSMYKTRF